MPSDCLAEMSVFSVLAITSIAIATAAPVSYSTCILVVSSYAKPLPDRLKVYFRRVRIFFKCIQAILLSKVFTECTAMYTAFCVRGWCCDCVGPIMTRRQPPRSRSYRSGPEMKTQRRKLHCPPYHHPPCRRNVKRLSQAIQARVKLRTQRKQPCIFELNQVLTKSSRWTDHHYSLHAIQKEDCP